MREEEEEVTTTTNDMNNDDDKANIKSDFDNNRIGDGDDNCNLNRNQISQVWGTWEELVLTCAVKRHGLTDWDSVAKEVQSRSRGSSLVSAGNCRVKYRDLKRRFRDSGDDGERNSEAAAVAAEVEDGVGEITWMEELRKLRVAELRRDVQRCDDSIRSLQIKVKKLEEEKDGDDGDKKPDLKDDDAKAVKSRSNEIDEPARLNRETTESDRENRSMNESNSTASVDKTADHVRLRGDKTVQACTNSKNPDPDPVNKAAEEDEGTVSMRSGMSHSGELGESGTSTVLGKRKAKKHRSGEDNSIRGGDIKSAGDKSQPLIDIIKLILSHPRGSVFESRLRSQETKDYKKMIKQHLDIKTIEKKLKKGCYDSSSNLCFYRDIKLLFTNAIAFFPPSSSESKAAHELRTLVSNEIKKQIKTEPESSVSKQKSSPVLPPPPSSSIVVCKKKKSFVSKKTTSPSSSSVKQKDENKKKKSEEVSEEKKTVSNNNSGRSSRKTNDVVVKDNKTGRTKNGNKKQMVSSSDDDDDDDDESLKTENKKKETVALALDKKKKKSVVDFLKRIKKNSPEKAKETMTRKDDDDHHDQKRKKSDDGNGKKESNGKAKPRELRSNSTGKKKAEVENGNKRKEPRETGEGTTGKRSRESGKEDKQPKKRSRR